MEIYRRSEKKNGVSRLVVFETSKCTRLFHPVFRWLPYLMTILNRSYPRSRGREGSMREDFSAPLVLDGFHRPGKISATKFVCTQVRLKPNRTETYPLVGGGVVRGWPRRFLSDVHGTFLRFRRGTIIWCGRVGVSMMHVWAIDLYPFVVPGPSSTSVRLIGCSQGRHRHTMVQNRVPGFGKPNFV